VEAVAGRAAAVQRQFGCPVHTSPRPTVRGDRLGFAKMYVTVTVTNQPHFLSYVWGGLFFIAVVLRAKTSCNIVNRVLGVAGRAGVQGLQDTR
jgi:hypothetical protein